MNTAIRYGCVALWMLALGCTQQSSAKIAPKPILDEFTKVLSGLEQAIETAASAGSSDQQELADDLRHRVGQLEESVSELQYRSSNKADAQATLNVMSQTLADSRKAVEGTLDWAKLREEVGKLKAQTEELKPRL